MPVEKIAVITRLTTQNAGNEALSRELIRFLQRRPNAEVRALDRYPLQLEHLRLAALAAGAGADTGAGKLIERFDEARAAPGRSLHR